MTSLLLASVLLLAYVNGANDNMKGVATLYGSRALGYRAALVLATLTTTAGALLSWVVASGLVRAFSARGLVPDSLLDASLLTAVAAGAAVSVLLATRLGLPVSTTHAILGALAGAGAVAAGSELDLARLASRFALPLLLGPALAIAGAAALWAAAGARIQRLAQPGSPAPEPRPQPPLARRTAGFALRPSPGRLVHGAHLVSAGSVGFARGLNDAPKIVGLLVGGAAVGPWLGTLLVAGAMALGGWLQARRVTRTLAQEITSLAPARGLLANVTTSLLVLAASRLSLPVSTTHVSTGGIVGVGGAAGELRWPTVLRIFAAWVTTLPLAALLAALFMGGLS